MSQIVPAHSHCDLGASAVAWRGRTLHPYCPPSTPAPTPYAPMPPELCSTIPRLRRQQPGTLLTSHAAGAAAPQAYDAASDLAARHHHRT